MSPEQAADNRDYMEEHFNNPEPREDERTGEDDWDPYEGYTEAERRYEISKAANLRRQAGIHE